MIVGVEADPAAVAIGSMPASIPVGTPAITGVALGVVICAAESVLFRTLIGVPGPGTVPIINRLIAPNQAYVLVGGWILAAAAGVLFAAARSGVVGWSTRPSDRSPSSPAPDPADGTAVMAAIGLVVVAVPLSILAVSGGPGAIPAWRAGFAGATAAAIGGALALAARRLPVARIVALAYAVSFWTEILVARVVGRLSTSSWVEGSAGPAGADRPGDGLLLDLGGGGLRGRRRPRSGGGRPGRGQAGRRPGTAPPSPSPPPWPPPSPPPPASSWVCWSPAWPPRRPSISPPTWPPGWPPASRRQPPRCSF